MKAKNQKQKHNKVKSKKVSIGQHATNITIAVNVTLLILNIIILSFIPQQSMAIGIAKSEIQALELQNQSAQKLLADLQASQEEKARIEDSLPTKSSLLEIIELIESLNSEVKVQNFQFMNEEPIQDTEGFIFLPIALVLEGTLNQTMNALHKLQTSKYLFSVDQTLIESPNGITQTVKLSVTLKLYVKQPFI